MPRLTGVVLVALALAFTPAVAAALPPTQPDPGAWVPDNAVTDVVHVGRTTYLSGFFNWVGPWTGSGADVSVPGGTNNTAFPIVAGGPILASAPDGAGGVYIGGSFTSVDGKPLADLAHIEANGTIETALPSPNAEVTALAFVPGSGLFDVGSLYVAGKFTSIGGVQREGLAEVDTSALGDSVSDTFAPCTDYEQNDDTGDQPYAFALAVSSSTVYIGGDFDLESGGPANPTTHAPTCTTGNEDSGGVFAVSRSTGDVDTAFQPNTDGEVDALALSPDDSTLYVGGKFDYIPGASSPFLAAVDSTTGAVNSSWLPQAKGNVYALATSGSTVYAGGSFKQIGANAAARLGVAQLDGVGGTANATSFDAGLQPSIDDYETEVNALALDDPTAPTRLAIGGSFATSSGADNLALADPSTGATTTGFGPNPGGEPTAVSFLSPSSLYAGGSFDSVGAVYRPGIVALDGYGHPTSTVFAGAQSERTLAVSPDGRTLLASGDGGPGAWSTSTGAALPWTPPPFSAAAFSPDSSLAYVGGDFTTIDGSPHVHLAALSTATGAPTSWSPDPDGAVDAIAVSPDGQTVYAGGAFQHIGISVASRSNLAALSAATGDVTPWSPNPNSTVQSLAVTSDGAHVFAGGLFTMIGAQPQARVNLAELTASTANPTPFAQTYAPNNSVSSVAPADGNSVVYVGGLFNAIGPTAAPSLAALDGGGGSALPWNPPVGAIDSQTPSSVAADGDTVWTGNWSTQLGTDLRPNYAQFSTTPASIAPPALSASPLVGTAVTCNSGGWSNAPATVTVSWSLDGTPIAGGTSRTYTPTSQQAGDELSCTETAANPGGSASATSAAATVPKPSSKPTNPMPPPKHKLTLHVSAKGTRLKVKLSAAATLELTLTKKGSRKHTHRRWRLRAGTSKLKLGKLHAGHYTATLVAAAGRTHSNKVKIKLTVVK